MMTCIFTDQQEAIKSFIVRERAVGHDLPFYLLNQRSSPAALMGENEGGARGMLRPRVNFQRLFAADSHTPILTTNPTFSGTYSLDEPIPLRETFVDRRYVDVQAKVNEVRERNMQACWHNV